MAELNADGTPKEEEKVEEVEEKPTEPATEEVKVEEEKKEKEAEPVVVDDTVDVPTRRSNVNASEIITRQKKTITKLRDGEGDGEGEGEGEGEAAPAPTDVSEEIGKQLAPVVEAIAKTSDEGELADLLKDNPEAKPYEKLIRKYMDHDSYKGVPPEVIYNHLVQKATKAVAATKAAKDEADKVAAHSQGGGHAPQGGDMENSDLPTKEQLEAMSDEDIGKMEHDILTGKYKPN